MTTEVERELARLRAYEKATRNTICWGVECAHEAKALDFMIAVDQRRAKAEVEADQLRALVAELASLVELLPSGIEGAADALERARCAAYVGSESARKRGTR